MNSNALKRKDLVLKLIVEDFIRTAEPVGSMNLIKNHKLKLSSATIRNTMADLEKEGYLEKTHTSSGRVPSTKGYEYYVNKLADANFKSSLNDGFVNEFALVLKECSKSIDDMISEACSALSDVTQLATVVLGEGAANEKLVSVSMVPISNTAATVILVTDQGHVESKTFSIVNSNINAVTFGIKLLNDRLTGTRIVDIENKMKLITPIFKSQVGKDSQFVLNAFMEAFVNFTKKRFKAFGTKNLLKLPEFKDDEMFKEIIASISDGSQIDDLSETRVDEETSVSFSESQNMAMISKTFKIPGMPEKNIAVVGPKRMDYKQIISALNSLSDLIIEFYTDGNNSSGGKDE